MRVIISIIVWFLTVLISLILFPLSVLLWFLTYPFDPERIIMHWWFVCHGIIISRLNPFWKVRVEGREKAEKGKAYVFISNHQSLLDILILNCLKYRFRWISKIENSRMPIIGLNLLMAKYITIDRGNPDSKVEMLAKSAESLARGISIMIFPEGTRSPDSEIAPFKLGAFQLALMTDKPILPIVIDGTGKVLPKKGLVFRGSGILRIKVLEPVNPGSFGTADPEELAMKFNKQMKEELGKMRNELR